jgi:hypothetical protein
MLISFPEALKVADPVTLLRDEKNAVEQRLAAIKNAITTLVGGEKEKRVKRDMSAATKRKLSIAAKAHWAKAKK